MSKVTVVEYVHYQEERDQPVTLPTRYSRALAGAELPYTRRIKPTAEWQELEYGWLKNGASLLKLANVEKMQIGVVPTLEQLTAHRDRIVEVGVGVGDVIVPFAIVRPGEDMRIEPVGRTYVRGATVQMSAITR